MIRLNNGLNSITELSTIIQLQDIATDLILMMCGHKVGAGAYRTVYEFNMNPEKMVIKLEPNSTDCNISEFLLWDEVQGLCGNLAWVKDWFAPIRWCSPNGKVIVMDRTKPMSKKKRPDKIPEFFTDIKNDNFGWIGDNFVCHDYGFIHKFIKYEKKFQKAIWD